MNIDQAQQSYHNDPVFHNLVKAIRLGIEQGNYTPGEVRAACMLACIQFENERHVQNPREYYYRVPAES